MHGRAQEGKFLVDSLPPRPGLDPYRAWLSVYDQQHPNECDAASRTYFFSFARMALAVGEERCEMNGCSGTAPSISWRRLQRRWEEVPSGSCMRCVGKRIAFASAPCSPLLQVHALFVNDSLQGFTVHVSGGQGQPEMEVLVTPTAAALPQVRS